jgi:exosortase/archaeosortase family protein
VTKRDRALVAFVLRAALASLAALCLLALARSSARLDEPLQVVTAWLSARATALLGVATHLDGTSIYTEHGIRFDIVFACTGAALGTVVVAIPTVASIPRRRKAFLVALGFFAWFIGNQVRIVSGIVLSRTSVPALIWTHDSLWPILTAVLLFVWLVVCARAELSSAAK